MLYELFLYFLSRYIYINSTFTATVLLNIVRHLIKFSRNINSIFLKTNVLVIVNFDCTTDLRKWWQMSSLETFPDTGEGTCHRAKLFLVNHWRNTQVWDRNTPSHQQGPGCYDAITCIGNELYLSWIGFCFMNIGKINQLKKIYGPYVLFVWHLLYMYIELIRRNYVDDIGDNVTDKLYYPEITVYNPKKNGGGCHTLI